MADRPVFIATRGSALALAQANAVLAQCRAAFPAQAFDLKIVRTTGDRLLTASLAQSDLPKGLFTKELEAALLAGEADLAVHSLKDLPTDLPPGLKLGAAGERADVRDVLIGRQSGGQAVRLIDALPPGATIATSSTRRSSQLQDRRPDLKVVPLRGNVGTRLKKLAEQPGLDGILLAAAGLQRLGFTIPSDGCLRGDEVPAGLIATPIGLDEMLPAVGQAALGLEIREGEARASAICAKLNHQDTWSCITAERAFLKAMGGGCHLAVAAYAQVLGSQLHLRAVSFLSGAPRRGEAGGPVTEPVELGHQLARELGAVM
jgi:hydroxymethylbilane synthase